MSVAELGHTCSEFLSKCCEESWVRELTEVDSGLGILNVSCNTKSDSEGCGKGSVEMWADWLLARCDKDVFG